VDDGRAAQIGQSLVLYLVTMLLSLTVHEFAHAWVADRLGDDTPRRQGRLTLSPLAHYDFWGTLVIPTVGILLGGIAFLGWARPVETNPGRYTRRLSMRNGHRLVAFAGPLSNLLLAVLAAGLLATLQVNAPAALRGQGLADAGATLLAAFMGVNLGLFVLNLIPLPPLDGSRLLPRSLDGFQQAVAPYSFFIVMIILNVPALRSAFFWPVGAMGAALSDLFGLHAGLS
jgi:Zn-dependent protease